MLSMAHRPAARKRPVVNAAPRSDVVQSGTPAFTGGGFAALLESATQQILAVTYWFDPALHPGYYPFTGRFSRRRLYVKKGGKRAWAPFCPDETHEQAVPR